MKFIQSIFLVLIFSTALSAQEEEHTFTTSRPDGHAPISVMGDHMHKKGDFMVSYRYQYGRMEDLRRGNTDVSFTSVLRPNGGQYMVTPTIMTMDMHMLGAMYAPTDNLTVMAMSMFMSMEMDHLTAMGGNFTTASSAIGDTQVSLLYKMIDEKRHQWHGQVGISVPTGSIDEEDGTPASMGNEVILPYPMQIGSGTYDAIAAFTYNGQSKNFSWGSQLRGVFRTGDNDNEYRLGNQVGWNNWIAYKALDWMSVSGRIQALVNGDITGANPDLNPNMVITADTANSGADFLNAGFGLNFYAPELVPGARVAVEYELPLEQNLNGVQLKQQERITLGVQYAF